MKHPNFQVVLRIIYETESYFFTIEKHFQIQFGNLETAYLHLPKIF